MDLSHLLEHYGYAAVFVGTLAEGESMLLLGGYAAHREYLELPLVIATAFIAAVAGDQIYFHLGRRYGPRLLARQPRLNAKVTTAVRMVERHGTSVVLAMRFMWGLRTALPLAVGMSAMTARRFLVLDLLAAALWSTLIACIGFGAMRVLTRWIDDLHRHEHWIVGILLLIALGAIVRRWRPGGSAQRRNFT
jgi:membrane protein DedA with SNARE-associated domain